MKAVYLISLFLLTGLAAFPQSCDQCSRPHVALYDSYISVSRPTSTDSLVAWYNLFWPAASARDYLRANDPKKDCITWIDGAMVNARDLRGDVLVFGSEFINLPAPGPLNSCDYLITGVVIPFAGSYHYTISLETGVSRELVKRVGVAFDANQNSAFDAGQKAAEGMMPLFDIIREFEINKRNNDTGVAIRDLIAAGSADVITIKPQKTKVNTGDTVDVDITMTDCDGVPLSNRIIIFKDTTVTWENPEVEMQLEGTTGGEIFPKVDFTDDQGKVTVQFKAGNNPGLAEIVGWYPHRKPCGRAAAFHGSALIQVSDPPPDLWLLDALIINKYRKDLDTIVKYSFEPGHSQEEIYSQYVESLAVCTVRAAIKNQADDPSVDFIYDSEGPPPVAMVVSGQGYSDQLSIYRHTINGHLVDAADRTDNARGMAHNGAGIQFYYTNDYKRCNVYTAISANGAYHGRDYDGMDWSAYDEDISDYTITCFGGGDGTDSCFITKNSYGFRASWVQDIYEKTIGPAGTYHIYQTGEMYVSVTPYNPGTLSKGDKEQLFPGASSLSQNFPNPFSSKTSITYQLEKPARVNLMILDMLGNTVATLVDAMTPQGTYTMDWDSGNLPQGVYFCRLQAGGFTETRQMLLIK